ncbi:MAG: Tm-1-like ATP-binding domain-containing protein [Rhodospirillaceae bacterium]|jgi:uncharacterized protein (UPF0261 family)|nr:Tm-1-like ATP-binding domain-containing protein [Rhodospirillaceae bacterium]MBT5897149.1 Tm-1-like ATP-binding domain-containing protein [Rhodospirillaceae bacterium]MBT6429522.1 Tm-1-like ATP-binding domain-containing protein [Rhodospirillaceae bacterium]MBT7760831.1 Tm-1-like ATP-binding domain-containing protein [Rhodospirillaceae bacterium]
MTKTIAIVATFDTKGAECAYLRDEIVRMGAQALLIDIGVVDDAAIDVDITNAEIATKGGTELAELRQNPSREIASEVMIRGATDTMLDLITSHKVDGMISLGGTQGTNNCCRVMAALPYGFPKVMLSTMASGDTSGYVGIKDITMMFSVSDILGLNPFFRRILSNAAGAVVGMAEGAIQVEFDTDKPVVGITNLGVLTQGTMRAMELLADRGYETIVFHAVGAGGRAMEQLMREGFITAVLDYALGDITDALFGGIRAADAERLTVAGELGIPQVVVPGGVDHIGIMLDEPNTVPDAYKDRIYSYHNPVILVPRTTGPELVRMMEEIRDRLAGAKANTVFMLPKKGVSSYSVEGGVLFDAESDAAFFAAVHDLLPDHIPLIEVEAAAEDPAFVERAVDELVKLIEGAKT